MEQRFRVLGVAEALDDDAAHVRYAAGLAGLRQPHRAAADAERTAAGLLAALSTRG